MKITNTTNQRDKIVPLFESFWHKESINRKNNDIDFFKMKKVYRFKEQEEIKEYSRKIDLLISDVNEEIKNKEEDELESEDRAFIRDRYLSSSKTYFNLLKNNGLEYVIKNKKEMCKISHFIDTGKIIEEFDKLEKAPCGDKNCNSIIRDIKEKTKVLGADECDIDPDFLAERAKEIALVFKNWRHKVFSKELCLNCYTILNMYGFSYFLDKSNILGFTTNMTYIMDSIFVDITNKRLFTLESVKTLTHEYIHYLSINKELNYSGFVINSNREYNQAYRILSEGLTELLTCYFIVENLKMNTLNTEVKYKSMNIKKDEYSIKINPYLKDFSSFYPDVQKFIENNGEEDKRVLCNYKFNVYLICYVMQKIGIKFVIECFFTNNLKDFNNSCFLCFGRNNWISFLEELSKYDNTLTKKDFEELKLNSIFTGNTGGSKC